MRVAVGHSADPDTAMAMEDIIAQCVHQLGRAQPQVAVVFACMDSDLQLVLSELRGRWPQMSIVGCTTDGELSSTLLFQEDSIAVMLFTCETLVLRVGLGRDLASSPARAAADAIRQATEGMSGTPSLCLTLPESLTTSADSVVRALSAVLGAGVPIVGGVAGDQWRFEGTYQLFNDEIVQDSLPVLLFYGSSVPHIGVASGWKPLGRVGRVTRATGNLLHEIDGQPAMEFYRRYFGDHVSPNPEHPLAVYERQGAPFYLRAPLHYDRDLGSITFVGTVPEGTTVQVTMCGPTDMLDACEESVDQALASLGNRKPEAALIFSCAARKQLLGTRTAEEARILYEKLGQVCPMLGFYTYGEIAPQAGEQVADFYNETFVTLLLCAPEAEKSAG